MGQVISAKEMKGVHSEEYCDKHGVEKDRWIRDPRVSRGGYWKCRMCDKEDKKRFYSVPGREGYRKEAAWKHQGINITYSRWQTEATHCRICGSVENLVADHNHISKQFRGVLCQSCNLGLGKFKDNPQYLRCAELYLGGQPCW